MAQFPEPVILSISEKKLIGKHLTMSMANNQTFQLWQSFMPHRQKITNAVNSHLYSLQIYPPNFDFSFADQNVPFVKWAAVEVADVSDMPPGMDLLTLAEGLYAVFAYKGLSTDTTIFQYIFGTWLPNSDYGIDSRPHFEILGEKYRNNDPDSEEEIWIPIRLKIKL